MADEEDIEIIDVSEICSELHEIKNLIHRVLRNQSTIRRELRIMATNQEQLDALVASEDADISAMGDSITGLQSSATAIAAEIAALKAANPAVDFTGLAAEQAKLDASLKALGDAASAVASNVPAAPAP